MSSQLPETASLTARSGASAGSGGGGSFAVAGAVIRLSPLAGARPGPAVRGLAGRFHLALPPPSPFDPTRPLTPDRALSRCTRYDLARPYNQAARGHKKVTSRSGTVAAAFEAKVGKTLHRNDPPRMAGRFDHRIYLWRSSKEKHR